jgi:hypothetical protein
MLVSDDNKFIKDYIFDLQVLKKEHGMSLIGYQRRAVNNIIEIL